MGKEEENGGLQVVAGMVPPEVKQIVDKLAADEDRTVSKIVRRLLEESPRVKTALRQQRRAATRSA